jgi:hypothetical protein
MRARRQVALLRPRAATSLSSSRLSPSRRLTEPAAGSSTAAAGSSSRYSASGSEPLPSGNAGTTCRGGQRGACAWVTRAWGVRRRPPGAPTGGRRQGPCSSLLRGCGVQWRQPGRPHGPRRHRPTQHPEWSPARTQTSNPVRASLANRPPARWTRAANVLCATPGACGAPGRLCMTAPTCRCRGAS